MQINRQNLKWMGRMMLILLLVVVADGLLVQFVRRPFPWVVLIPALLLWLTCVFAILPLTRAEKPIPPGA